MPVLNWDKPKKLRPTAEHNALTSSDSGVAGTYVPNMSEKDRLTWKAKLIGGQDPRVEIRKTVQGKEPGEKWPSAAQMLLIVRPDGSVVMSANARCCFSAEVWLELSMAIEEVYHQYGIWPRRLPTS